MTNSVAPTAKSDLNSIDPWAVSPRLIWAMNAVIVWTLSVGSSVNCGFVPTASSTAIVSPIARLVARMIDAMIPDSAAGRTTLRTTSNFVAPIA